MSTQLSRNRQWIGGAVVITALLLAPLLLSDFRLGLLGRFLAYAILALGLDLIWGYTGILSLGHGVYFGLGAYCAAMYLKLEATGGKLPEFMGYSGIEQLPFFWQPFRFAWLAFPLAMIVPAALAAMLGYFAFRSRIKGVFFSILSQALALVMVTLFLSQIGLIGGTNGITNFKTIFGHDINDSATQRAFYFLTVATLALTYVLCRWLVHGRFGKLLLAIRDAENRVRFTGYDPVGFKVFVYAISAALAGLAGVLFVLQVGLITPTEMDVPHSIRMVLWVALGGRATLIGPILGTLLVNFGENALSESYPAMWSLMMGVAFLACILFMPRGLMGLVNDANRWIKNRRERSSSTRIAEKSVTSHATTETIENSVV
ncbi:MAG TPA: urea ABC transporter permease subunit UrtC [Abditibacteriaceae bacterium]|jgi:urea transport system permease protein